MVLQKTLKKESKRRVSPLIAQKSVHGFIGWASRQVGAIPVGRAQDSAKPATGTIYLPDPVGDPTLVRGIGTKFDEEGEVSGMVFLPSVKGQTGASVDIAEIIGPEELRLKRPFSGKTAVWQLTGRSDIDDKGALTDQGVKGCPDGFKGTNFKLAAHIDQSKVYHAVFNRFKHGGCVGIFPEGGSHDRTRLLPLKAGVAIMALGTLAENPDCGLKIVPCGLNYFHAHKFRSRAVIEFGAPFEVPSELVHMYQTGRRRDAIGQLLDMVQTRLAAVTVSTADYDTLMLIQAARRLYISQAAKRPLGIVIEANRRLALGYEKYKDDPRVKEVKESVKKYNSQLMYFNLRDHQVQHARLGWFKVLFLLISRSLQLLFLLALTIPGLVLFAPVFIMTKTYSRKKAAEALAASTVKIEGRDVMATWKILVAMVVAPLLYNVYAVSMAFFLKSDRCASFVPAATPWLAIYLGGWAVFPGLSYIAFRVGEVGMDIFKSLRPLFLCLFPSSNYSVQKLREQRTAVQQQVNGLIDELGPEMFEDWEATRLVKPSSPSSPTRPRADSEQSSTPFEADTASPPHPLRRSSTVASRSMPRNESFSNIGRIGMFSTTTEPPSRSRSRSSSSGGGFGMAGFPVSGFTSLDTAEGLSEATRKIHEAMQKRGEIRRRQSKTANDFRRAEDDESGDEDGSHDDEKQKKNS